MTRSAPLTRTGLARGRPKWGEGEGYIPWSQIEPLATPGMTANELGHAVLARLGITATRYTLLCKPGRDGRPVAEWIRHGLEVATWDEARRRRLEPPIPDAVIA